MVDIRVLPERLRSVASSLEGQRQEVDSVLDNMVAAVSNLQGEWAGLAQVDYAQIFDNQVPPMRARIAETLGTWSVICAASQTSLSGSISKLSVPQCRPASASPQE
jgi:WXG100 family type VII secretion target